jgi:hypothetical protein
VRAAMLVVAAVVAAVALTGCEDGDGDDVPLVTDVQPPPSPDAGIQATGTLDGQRVAISRGNPIVVVGDCDANDGLDEDLCILSRTIDGRSVNLVVENPAVLVPGETVQVVTCDAGCDEVTDGVVVELRLDDGVRPAEGGRLVVAEAGPRWIAEFDLRLPSGDRLIGSFDVEPTPPE